MFGGCDVPTVTSDLTKLLELLVLGDNIQAGIQAAMLRDKLLKLTQPAGKPRRGGRLRIMAPGLGFNLWKCRALRADIGAIGTAIKDGRIQDAAETRRLARENWEA
jgi:hypothetical protein